MDEIFARAEELGRMIGETETGRRYHAASELLREDPDTLDILGRFSTLNEEMKRRRQMGDIIARFEIERHEEMADEISGNEKIMEYLDAQREYVELLVMIQREIEGT